MKGLTPKYAVRWPHEECRRLDCDKIEYTQDEEGRTWRRVGRRRPGPPGSWWWTTTRWHVADPYEWFPAPSPEALEGARRQNNRARVPKVDVYLIAGREIVVLPRPKP